VIPCAFLRVFRPLETFRDEERARWERYILSGGTPPVQRRVYREASELSAAGIGLLAPAEGEFADVRLVDGQYYVCPWRTRLRILASILSLRQSAPAEVADAFVPEGEARRAARELARMKRRDPSAVPCMLQSAWHVPVRWFLLVGDDERRLVAAPPGAPAGYRLYYWTPISMAKKRTDRAARALRATDLGQLAQVVHEMAEWLSAFPPESRVELDYGAVSSLFSWDELDDDHSGRDIQEAVDALAHRRSTERATELYQSVASRWAEALSHESMN
jgi:hypothetical protein